MNVLTYIGIIQRFWGHVKKTKKCWEWQHTKDRYGRFCIGSRKDNTRRFIKAHRFSWELSNGGIPFGMYILHKCDNGKCVRPSHLFIGNQLDNMRDMANKGRGNLAKIFCKRGHKFDELNTLRYINIYGKYIRICRACKRIANHKRRHTMLLSKT